MQVAVRNGRPLAVPARVSTLTRAIPCGCRLEPLSALGRVGFSIKSLTYLTAVILMQELLRELLVQSGCRAKLRLHACSQTHADGP